MNQPHVWTRRRLLRSAVTAGASIVAGSACGTASAAIAGPLDRSAASGAVTVRRQEELAGAAAMFTPRAAPGYGAVDAVPPEAADVGLTRRGERGTTGRYRLSTYRGLGCWIDVFDWSVAYAGPTPPIGPQHMGFLAQQGVHTVYLQTARYDRPSPSDDLLERSRLLAIVDAAHLAGMKVVAWYLPTHSDHQLDVRRSYAVLAEPSFDGFALDIESRSEPDVALRNQRLAALVAEVRNAAGPTAAIGAITVPPTTMEDVNPNYWPGFDWAMLATTLDVFLPMNYWTNRLSDSPWRDAAASTRENIRRLRSHAGRNDYPVHVVGGIANLVNNTEVAAMVSAVRQEGADGASLYDVATTPASLWPALQGLPD